MADIIIEKIYKQPVFTWGDSRAEYLKAVKAADHGDYSMLLLFARSWICVESTFWFLYEDIN